MSRSPPPHWPKDVVYLSSPTYHASVTMDARKFMEPSPVKKGAWGKSSVVVIRRISSPEHPASGQLGLFAAKKIPPKTHIVDYIGIIHCENRRDSDYDLCLHRFEDGSCIGVDAGRMGNEARFVNDFRGIKNKPNAVFADRRNEFGDLRMGIWSSHEGIKKGEEIVVSYGKAWWLARAE
ncbi:SET domain protein [Armillaria luteobubalina]|uniref:SET domain protein n=1 Tax=Armillaria luteobubalina TaxID=153913 RepID=A0AA39UWC1_9AGAR|nr:SET domain protein [Armillaria luteobubalina]